MTILNILAEEHKKASGLFKKIESTSNDEKEKRKELFTALSHDLEVHLTAEEDVFYSQLRDKNADKLRLLESIEEHRVAQWLLENLDRMPVNTDEWMSKIIVLRENIEHHVCEEEQETFQLAKKLLTTEQLEKIGKTYLERKNEMAQKLKEAS